MLILLISIIIILFLILILLSKFYPLIVVWDLDQTLLFSTMLDEYVNDESLNTKIEKVISQSEFQHVDDDLGRYNTKIRPNAYRIFNLF